MANLLTLIAVSGEVGVSVEEATQAIRDVAHVGPDAAPTLYPSAAISGTLDQATLEQAALGASAFRNRLDVYKNNLSRTLNDFGIQIQTYEGRIRLINGVVCLVNTPWTSQGEDGSLELPASPKLLGLQLQVWQFIRA